MRSTRDIIVAVKEGQPVSEDELRIAVLVMSVVDAFTWRELYDLIEVIEQDKPGQAAAKAAFAKSILERMFQAKREDPAKWLGPLRGVAEKGRWQKISKKLLEKIEQEMGEPASAEEAKPKAGVREPKAMPGTPPATDLEATEKATHKKGRGRKATD
jgi:hypothetical protein